MAERPFTPERLAERRRPQVTKMLIWPMAFTPETFSEAYIIGKSTVYEEIKAGRLIARKVGRSTIILASDAEEWAKSLPRLKSG